MTRRAGRSVVAVLVLLAFSPTLVFGQAVKAGVVTTLEGQVTATRVAMPAPVSLRFKDDVFLQDRISTAENSFARLLLGGKAVVTVRERSLFSVTEIPGQSIVDLQSGKLAVGVARERMRPGEVLELRTPGAIVAVRGTVLIAEVEILPDGSRREVVYLLRGTAEAQARPAAGVAPRAPVALAPFQSVTIVGGVLTIATFTASDLPRITGGLKPRGMQLAASSSEAKKASQKATQDALATLLLVGDIKPFTPPRLQPETTVTVAPLETISCLAGAGCNNVANLAGNTAVSRNGGDTGVDGGDGGGGGTGTLIATVTSGRISGPGTVDLQPGGVPIAPPLGDPVFRIVDATVTQAAGDLIDIAALPATPNPSGPPVTQIPGRLLEIENSTVAAGSSLFRITTLFSSAGASSLIDVDPSNVSTPGDFVRVERGGTLFVSGAFLTAGASTLTAGGNLLQVTGGGSTVVVGDALFSFQGSQVTAGTDLVAVLSQAFLASGSSNPLVQVSGGSVTAGGSLLRVSGTGALEQETTSFAGTSGGLLAATSSSISTSGAVLRIDNGGQVAGSGPAPLLQLGATALTAPALVQVGNGSGGTPSVLALEGPLLVASNSPLSIPGSVVGVFENGILLVQPARSEEGPVSTGPLVALAGATHSVATNAGEAVVNLRGRQGNQGGEGCEGDCSLDVGTDVPLLHLGGGPLLEITNAAVGTQQAVKLVDASVDVNLVSSVAAALISLQGAGSALTTATDAVSLVRSRLDTLGPIALVNGSVFTVTSGAFLALDGSFLRVRSDLVQIANGGLVNVVNGPLVSLTNGSAAHVAGALAAFIAGNNNRLQISNNLCSGGNV